MGGMILPARLRGRGMNGRFGADPGHRAGEVRQPSLLELMSIEDWLRFVPETLGLLMVIAFMRYLMDASSPGASSMPHAFWIPVLLMAAQYGIMGGLFAAFSASLFYFAVELPTQSAAQDFYDYAAFAAAQPCAWFAAALVLGGLRTLHMHHQARLVDRLEETRAAAEELADRLTGAAREMDRIEQRIAADTATTSVLLGGFAEADLSSRQALLASFAYIFRHGADADSLAVYLWDGDRFAPRFGFEDGAPIPRAALASLPQLPGGNSECSFGETAAAHLPLRVAIRISDAAKPVGYTVCTRLASGQNPIIAVRRLQEVCRVLAKLLVVCPEDDPGTGGA
jgi:hypothetical protein